MLVRKKFDYQTKHNKRNGYSNNDFCDLPNTNIPSKNVIIRNYLVSIEALKEAILSLKIHSIDYIISMNKLVICSSY